MNVNKPAADKTYAGVQILRGLAALLVVAFHAGVMVRDWFGDSHLVLRAGAAGVDVFFPISGFVMVVASAGLLNRVDGWRIFLERRIIRIIPLYWLATTIKLLLVAAVPSLALHTVLMPWHVTASYLFIFAANSDGEPLPLLPVGWTLNFEMFFYAVFAAALYFRAPLVRSVGAIMLVVAAAGLLQLGTWTPALGLLSPLVLEFVAGMAIGRLTLDGYRMGLAPAFALAVAALAALFATDLLPAAEVERYRILLWGLPGAALLLAAVSLEPIVPRSWWLPRLLGDASYSIYLFHGFVLPAFGVALGKLGVGAMLGADITFAAAIAISSAAGVFVYLWIERPMTRGLSRWRWPRAVPATTATTV
jgi:exopolysaccharide production protein ExoZ